MSSKVKVTLSEEYFASFYLFHLFLFLLEFAQSLSAACRLNFQGLFIGFSRPVSRFMKFDGSEVDCTAKPTDQLRRSKKPRAHIKPVSSIFSRPQNQNSFNVDRLNGLEILYQMFVEIVHRPTYSLCLFQFKKFTGICLTVLMTIFEQLFCPI